MKKKGFTLVELLVVIAIIALLMGILMPALARVRQLAFRMTCGTNLAGIGKAMLIYSNDYDDELPKAGGRANTWATQLPDWDADNRRIAYGLGTGTSSTPGQVTVASSFYLLVKYAEVTPKSFICKGESDTREFKLADWDAPTGTELGDVWDFGYSDASNRGEPADFVSYCYHIPFGSYALTVSHEPTMAIAADRNPWMDKTVSEEERTADWNGDGDEKAFLPDLDKISAFSAGTAETAKQGNSNAHQKEGQNVLFLDSHVSFEKRSFVGIDNDNIYNYYTTETDIARIKGLSMPIATANIDDSMKYRKDSFLIQDGTLTASSGGSRGGGGR